MKRLLLSLTLVLLVAAFVPQKGNTMTTPTLHNVVVNSPDHASYFHGVTVQEDRATRILRIFKDGEQIATYLPDTGWVEWHDYDANEVVK
jgi:hypothetical protein